MSDSSPDASPVSDSSRPSSFLFHIGAKIRQFVRQRGGRPSQLSVEDMNVLVRVLNAFMNAQVVDEAPQSNPDGTPGAANHHFVLTEQGLKLVLNYLTTGGTSPNILLVNVIKEYTTYLQCSYGGTLSSVGAILQVLKPAILQYSNAVNLTDGGHTYSTTGVNTRTDTVSGVTVNEEIWPPYILTPGVYAQILACCPSNMGGLYYDLNVDARRWLQIALPCTGSGKQLADISFPYT